MWLCRRVQGGEPLACWDIHKGTNCGVLLVMRSLFSQTHSRPGERPVWYFHMLGLCTSYNYDDDQDGFGGDGKYFGVFSQNFLGSSFPRECLAMWLNRFPLIESSNVKSFKNTDSTCAIDAYSYRISSQTIHTMWLMVLLTVSTTCSSHSVSPSPGLRER